MKRTGFYRRLVALVRKETRQMLRDRANLAVGVALPVVLILLFGYGLSFDVTDARVAVVLDDSSPAAREVLAGMEGSPYLAPRRVAHMREAERLARAGDVAAIVRVPVDFASRRAAGQAQLQLIVNGVDTSTASAIEGYVLGALATTAQQQADRAGNKPGAMAGVSLVQRMWFNEAGNSTWYLVPGIMVLVLTLIGAFLTSLLIAREWERGTLESLFVTPVRPLELVLAKLAPYLLIGAIDLALCLLAAYFLFEVPIRGSLLAIITASMLYLLVSLLLGLFISGRTRNQFQASQVALLTSFLPAMMLSGFVFDLRNMPVAVSYIGHVLPATHFMGLVKTLFLAGDDAGVFLTRCGILAGYAVVLTVATTRTLRKRLD